MHTQARIPKTNKLLFQICRLATRKKIAHEKQCIHSNAAKVVTEQSAEEKDAEEKGAEEKDAEGKGDEGKGAKKVAVVEARGEVEIEGDRAEEVSI